MSVNELKEEWERLFASGAPNNSRSYLLSGNPHCLPYSGADPWRAVQEKSPDAEGAFGRDERQADGRPAQDAG
ncbi:MAG: hypothetical protein GXP03_11930 [Alphaproteobacteria bacterium]|nr:hypothetical protein [Alphaproteobacteria bacterium]